MASALGEDPPGLPTNLRVTATTANSITLACNAPTDGGTPMTYRWRYSTNNLVSNSDPMVTSTGTSVTITGLDSDSDYWFDVRAENDAGDSDYTTDVTGSTDAGMTLPDAVAPNVTIAAVGSVDEDETQTLSASVSGGTYDSLAYAWSVISGGGTISGSGSSVTYNPPNVSSNASVTARCTVTATGTGTNAANGTSDTDSDDEAFTVNVVTDPGGAPGIPTNVTAAFNGNITLSVSFDHPSTGGTPTRYRAYWFHAGLAVWAPTGGNTRPYPETQVTFGNDFGTSYTKGRVRAENDAGSSDWVEADI